MTIHSIYRSIQPTSAAATVDPTAGMRQRGSRHSTKQQQQPLAPSSPRPLAGTAEALAEARLRLLTILKHVYWGSFQSGLLSPEGIRSVVWRGVVCGLCVCHVGWAVCVQRKPKLTFSPLPLPNSPI